VGCLEEEQEDTPAGEEVEKEEEIEQE